MKIMNKRVFYGALFLFLLLTEVLIALYVHDSFIRPYVGDALVVAVLYCLVRVVWTEGHRRLPLYVFLFAAGIEILQYFHLVEMLGLSGNRLAGIVLGSTFDFLDIVCYGVGALAIAAAERHH